MAFHGSYNSRVKYEEDPFKNTFNELHWKLTFKRYLVVVRKICCQKIISNFLHTYFLVSPLFLKMIVFLCIDIQNSFFELLTPSCAYVPLIRPIYDYFFNGRWVSISIIVGQIKSYTHSHYERSTVNSRLNLRYS